LTDYRDGVKGALNTLLFAGGDRVRLPTDIKAELPPRWTMRKVRSAIVEKHPMLGDVIERGRGLSLMFTESQVLVALLLKLLEDGIVALPMHDEVMVAQSHAEAARQTMEDVARNVVGFPVPAVIKGID
jgi:hypothetical protein